MERQNRLLPLWNASLLHDGGEDCHKFFRLMDDGVETSRRNDPRLLEQAKPEEGLAGLLERNAALGSEVASALSAASFFKVCPDGGAGAEKLICEVATCQSGSFKHPRQAHDPASELECPLSDVGPRLANLGRRVADRIVVVVHFSIDNSQFSIRSRNHSATRSSPILSCRIVSRSRMVTVPSSSVWPSTVIPRGCRPRPDGGSGGRWRRSRRRSWGCRGTGVEWPQYTRVPGRRATRRTLTARCCGFPPARGRRASAGRRPARACRRG
jgi:hypothetical protein